MTRTANVVVVGAGIIGASIAMRLASHGMTSVVVLDKGVGPAEGSTGASSSISRCRYTHPEVVRLARHGQQAYAQWRAFTGLAEPRSGLITTGVLWMMGETVSQTTESAAKLRGEGVEAEVFDAGDVARLFPMLSTCNEPIDLSGEVEHVCLPGKSFLYEPSGGYADPVGANEDLLEGARGLGVTVEFSAEVVDVTGAGSGVTGVVLADGERISAGVVVNAAGPWCNRVNAMAGWDHRWSLTPTRIQTVYRPWPEDMGSIPVGADSSTGIYFRPESGGQQVLVGSVREEDEREVVDDPDSFRRVPDPQFTERMLASLHHRVPGLEARGRATGVAGLYTINREDVHPIVGPTGIDGFWVANGFSGHGFKLAPAIGSLVAQALTGERDEFDTDVPLDFLAPHREPIELDHKNVLA